MEFTDAKIPRDCTIRFTGDWQVGSSTTSTHVIEKIMAPVYDDPKYRVVFVGDLWDHITPKDKRFSWEDLDEKNANVLAQVRTVANYIKPARKKVLSLGEGNHELVSAQEIGNLTKYLAEQLNVPYGGYSNLIRLNGKDQVMAWHGRPSIGSSLEGHAWRAAVHRTIVRTNRRRWPQYGQGQVRLFAQGHVNLLEVVRPEGSIGMHMDYDWEKQEITNRYEVRDQAFYAVCGSAQRLYVKGKTSYAEARGYGPLSLGCVDAHVKDGRIVDVVTVPYG